MGDRPYASQAAAPETDDVPLGAVRATRAPGVWARVMGGLGLATRAQSRHYATVARFAFWGAWPTVTVGHAPQKQASTARTCRSSSGPVREREASWLHAVARAAEALVALVLSSVSCGMDRLVSLGRFGGVLHRDHCQRRQLRRWCVLRDFWLVVPGTRVRTAVAPYPGSFRAAPQSSSWFHGATPRRTRARDRGRGEQCDRGLCDRNALRVVGLKEPLDRSDVP